MRAANHFGARHPNFTKGDDLKRAWPNSHRPKDSKVAGVPATIVLPRGMAVRVAQETPALVNAVRKHQLACLVVLEVPGPG